MARLAHQQLPQQTNTLDSRFVKNDAQLQSEATASMHALGLDTELFDSWLKLPASLTHLQTIETRLRMLQQRQLVRERQQQHLTSSQALPASSASSTSPASPLVITNGGATRIPTSNFTLNNWDPAARAEIAQKRAAADAELQRSREKTRKRRAQEEQD